VERTGQNVEQKSPDEFVRREDHDFLLILVAVGSPAKFHLAIFNVDQPMIGNHPMRVAAQILKHTL
jgi:hypothetical protein